MMEFGEATVKMRALLKNVEQLERDKKLREAADALNEIATLLFEARFSVYCRMNKNVRIS